MHGIDCHVLCCPGEDPTHLLAQLADEPVNVWLCESGPPAPIGTSRADAFALGSAPWVTYADPDDEIVPGIFRKLAAVLAAYPNATCVGVNEIVRWQGRDTFAPIVRSMSLLDRLHHLTLLRRDRLSRYTKRGARYAGAELETVAGYLEDYPYLIYLDLPGYVWNRSMGSFSSKALEAVDVAALDRGLVVYGASVSVFDASDFGSDHGLIGTGRRYVVRPPRCGIGHPSIMERQS